MPGVPDAPTPPSPPPVGDGSATGAASALGFILLGFQTLTVQCVLLRELFSVLYGSDLAFGFALSSWTLLTAAGALAAARLRRLDALLCRWGLAGHAALAVGAFLAVRAWGAAEIIGAGAYGVAAALWVPPCLLGGALFPALLRRSAAMPTATAYAWEVTGGLAAGVLGAWLFHAGASSAPLLLGCLCLGLAPAVAAVRNRRIAAVVAASILALLPFSPPGRALERVTLRLHYRTGEVVDARNTPFAAMAAVRSGEGSTAVFENGLPWPRPESTPDRQALVASLLALPDECGRVVVLHGRRAGLGPVLAPTALGDRLTTVEEDPQALGFANRHQDGWYDSAADRVQFGGTRTLTAMADGSDLVAIMAAPPGGLQENRCLTAEFLGRLAPRLAPGGVCGVVLPTAPGFTHPDQERMLLAVEAAVRSAFPVARRIPTQVGWTIFAGSRTPLDLPAAAARVAERYPAARADALAEARSILLGEDAVCLDALAGRRPEPDGGLSPANRIGRPHAYFRTIQFRGRFVESAPAAVGALLRERSAWVSWALMAVVLGVWYAGPWRRHAVVFWSSWSATLSLILSIYLFQSLVGQVYWAISLLSAASMAGILWGTRTPERAEVHGLRLASTVMPAVVFALHPAWHLLPGWGVLIVTLLGTGLASWNAGLTFARQAAQMRGADTGRSAGILYAVDLLGTGGGLFLGGVLLAWWGGFTNTAVAGSLAALAALLIEPRGRAAAG